MASYVEKQTDNTSWPNPFQRTTPTPLDRSSMFASVADAELYVNGTLRKHDSRNLYRTSYVGQILTVYENGVVSVYKVIEDPNDETKKALARIDDNIIKQINVNGQECVPTSAGTVNIILPVTGVASADTILSLSDGLLNSTLGMSIDATFDENNKRWLRLTGVNGTEVAKVDVTDFVTLNYVKDITWNSATTTISATTVVNGMEQPALVIDLNEFLTKDDFDSAIFDTTGNSITIKADVFADYQDVEDIKTEIENINAAISAITGDIQTIQTTLADKANKTELKTYIETSDEDFDGVKIEQVSSGATGTTFEVSITGLDAGTY